MIKTSRIKFTKVKAKRQRRWRMPVLFIFLILFVGIIVFAQNNTADHDDYPSYTHDSYVHINADEYGYISIMPYYIDYDLHWHDASVALLFSQDEWDKESIEINLPDGWQYTVGYNQEIHDYYYWVPLMVFDYEDNEYQQLEKIAVIITFPDYMEPVISTPYEYEYDQEPDYNYEYGYDFEDHGYLGEAPDYALYSQYIGIMPLANFFVTFDNNDGGLTDPSDFAIRSTLNNGTIGAVNMPSNPERPGHRFFMWSRHQDGFGSIANDPQTGYIFNGSSIVTAGLNPFTVYAQWGYPVSFNCNYTTLVKPSDVYALSNSAQYGNRWVHLNRTHAQSNALSWTPAQPWPANPVNHNRDGNTFFFVGWYTMSGGNYIQRFDTNTVITGPTQLYARWSQRVLQFNPRDGITEPQDFARHYLYGTAAALSLGAGNRPPNPTHPNGYRFMGWTRTALGNGTGTAVSSRERFLDTDTFTLANSVPGTVFAQWGHQLTFDGNGTTLNILAIPNPNNSGCYSPRIVASGQSLSWIRDRTWGNLDFAINTTNQIIWPAPPTRENYVFGGWFTRENGEYNQHITDATPVFGDMTLYARWIHESEFDGRFVVFDPQNGTPSSEFIKVETLPAGNIGVDAWPTPNPVYLGHHFMAWTRTPDGSGTATGNIIGIPFNSNSVVAIGESPLTIYAQWAHRVSFDINGGTSAVPVTRYYRAGMSALESNALMWTTTVAWPANPVNRATHSFIGWYTRDGSDGYEERFYAHTPIHSDIVLYARWAERGVTFNLNDGGVTPADEFPWRPLIGTGNANVGAANWPYTPIYPGPLHFLAWTRTQDGGGSTAAVIPTTNFTIAEGSPTIFAQWGHRVTFDGDEHNLPAGFEPRYVIPGTSIAQTNTHPWITTTMPGIPPLRRGFNFVGWFEFGSNDMFTVDTIVNNDITLFARWEPLRVYFDPIDGVTLQPQFEMREFMWNGTLGAANVPDAPPPLADGRIFMNWVRPPSPQGSAGTTGGLDSGIFQWTPVSGATWIHAIESPLMAEARYGWIITFNCALSGPLPQGTTINQFSPRIVYNGHSATETNALTWTASTIIWPNPPSQPTMTFLGWYTKDSSGNYEQRVDAATQITNHMELHARWITRRVIFNPRDGITQEQDFEYRMLTDAVNAAMIGAMPENPVSPRFDGLHFIVYTRTEAGLGTATGTADREHIITGTLFPLANPPMVFGQWGHRIQFHGNGVAAAYHTRYVFPGATLAQSARIWNAATWPANPIVTSRVFLGWYTRDSLGNYESEFIFDPNHIWTGDLDLYARWDIGIVIFDPQDGTAQSTWETRELLGDNTVGEVNMPVPTRDGYRFMAWTRTDDGVVVPPWTANTTASTRIQFIGTATVTFAQSPHTVYAQWGHQVNFDAGPGASLGANSNTRVIRTGLSNWQNTALFWTPGAANVSAWPNNPVRTGYSFYGWYTRIGGAYAQRVDAHTPLDSSMVNAGSVNGDITLFARWIPTINMYVDFNPNDGGATLPSDFHRGQTNATGSVIAANFAPVPTWGNRIFLGWTRTQDGTGSIIGIPDGILFVQHTSASNTSTITAWESIFEVFAQWAHTITFNGNGVNLAAGTGVTGYGPRHISIGRNVAEHNALVWTTNITWPNPPVRGGYDFSGWYTRDSNGDFEAWFDATTQITDDLTLHAMWTVPYVHYHTNGGLHVGSVDPNYVHMRRVGPTPPPPTRTGYSFVAWTRTQSGDITPPWTNHTTAQSPSHAVTWGATSTVPVGMFPFSVYAQWGNRIDFNSGAPLGEFGGVAVGILPNHTNSNAVTGYGHRIIATGRTLPEHNFFAWSTNVIWPNNPTRLDSPAGFPGQRYLFNGWRITHNNQINGNFMGYFCPVNTVLYRNLILFAEWIPEEPHTVTFDMTHGVLIGENQSNIRRAWHNQTVCASSNVNWSVATRLNTNVAWPRSAPNVIRDVPVPMTVASWWTEPSGPYGDGVMWSRRGWNSGNNINGSATTPSTADTARWEGPATMTAVTEDITVFPNWVYRITFHPNGGNTPTNAGNRYRDIPARWCSNTLAYLPGNLANNGRHPNDSIQRNFAPQPTRTNHIFVGWWSEPIAPNVPLGEEAAHGHPNAVEFTLNCMVDRNITVYARWVPFYTPPIQTIEQLYVRFDLNNGGRWWTSTGNQPLPPGGIYGYRTVRVNQGGTVGTSRMPQIPIGHDGFIFMGWYDTPSGPGPLGGEIPPNLNNDRFVHNTAIHESRTVYAHWEPYVILTVNPNGGNFAVTQLNPSGPAGSSHHIMIAENRNFHEMRITWVDTSWFTSTSFNASFPRPPLHPRPNDFNNPQSVSISPPSIGTHTTRGANFVRMTMTQFWGRSATGAEPFFSDTTRVPANMTIYAQWRVNVTFVRNQTASDNTQSTSALIREGQTMREAGINMPAATTNWSNENPNFNIIGWNTARNGSGQSFDLDTPVPENMRVYAQWSQQGRILFHHGHAPAGTVPLVHRERVVTIIPGEQIATTFSPEDSAIVGLPPILPAGSVPGMENTWPGHTFHSWNTVISGTGAGALEVGNSFEIPYMLTIFAIWYGTVTFDATGGSYSHGGQANVDLQSAPNRIGQPIGAGGMPTNLSRPGWRPATVPGFPTEFLWSPNRFGLRDGNVGGLNDLGFRHNTALMQTQTVYAQWLADVHFVPEGGNGIINNQPSVTLAVPEGGSIGGHVVGGMPTPLRPGAYFSHWEVEVWCTTEGAYIWVTFDGTTIICDEHDRRFRRDSYGRIVVRAMFNDIFLNFAFYKTDMYIYEVPLDMDDVSFIPNARFYLYRWNHLTDNWDLINNNIVSAPDGRVTITDLTASGTYRLRETYAPVGFITPVIGSHWILRLERYCPDTYYVQMIYNHGGALPFVPVQEQFPDPDDPDSYLYRTIWYLGNQDGEVFTFRKADQRIFNTDYWPNAHNFLLPGARFRLFRTTDYTSQLSLSYNSDGLITLDSSGAPIGPWVEVPLQRGESSANFNEPIIHTMMRGFTYQLVEVLAPSGFQMPMGQWRIEACNISQGGFRIAPVGGVPMPGFVYIPCNCIGSCDYDSHWYLGNWPVHNLPLAGGTGAFIFTIAGVALLAASGLYVMVHYNKKNGKQAALAAMARSRYGRG